MARRGASVGFFQGNDSGVSGGYLRVSDGSDRSPLGSAVQEGAGVSVDHETPGVTYDR